ncbi:hypothetical protein CSUI_003954 [Cystoisospora suis]|uniref:Uncharacterized protein n=1 Tax=Cystoisospora suis TaxID=483139 RepID=A0A2C6L3G2_9APIC|nr:hypothetical protein CSUI_003954 [Cystoisospora suis]
MSGGPSTDVLSLPDVITISSSSTSVSGSSSPSDETAISSQQTDDCFSVEASHIAASSPGRKTDANSSSIQVLGSPSSSSSLSHRHTGSLRSSGQAGISSPRFYSPPPSFQSPSDKPLLPPPSPSCSEEGSLPDPSSRFSLPSLSDVRRGPGGLQISNFFSLFPSPAFLSPHHGPLSKQQHQLPDAAAALLAHANLAGRDHGTSFPSFSSGGQQVLSLSENVGRGGGGGPLDHVTKEGDIFKEVRCLGVSRRAGAERMKRRRNKESSRSAMVNENMMTAMASRSTPSEPPSSRGSGASSELLPREESLRQGERREDIMVMEVMTKSRTIVSAAENADLEFVGEAPLRGVTGPRVEESTQDAESKESEAVHHRIGKLEEKRERRTGEKHRKEEAEVVEVGREEFPTTESLEDGVSKERKKATGGGHPTSVEKVKSSIEEEEKENEENGRTSSPGPRRKKTPPGFGWEEGDTTEEVHRHGKYVSSCVKEDSNESIESVHRMNHHPHNNKKKSEKRSRPLKKSVGGWRSALCRSLAYLVLRKRALGESETSGSSSSSSFSSEQPPLSSCCRTKEDGGTCAAAAHAACRSPVEDSAQVGTLSPTAHPEISTSPSKNKKNGSTVTGFEGEEGNAGWNETFTSVHGKDIGASSCTTSTTSSSRSSSHSVRTAHRVLPPLVFSPLSPTPDCYVLKNFFERSSPASSPDSCCLPPPPPSLGLGGVSSSCSDPQSSSSSTARSSSRTSPGATSKTPISSGQGDEEGGEQPRCQYERAGLHSSYLFRKPRAQYTSFQSAENLFPEEEESHVRARDDSERHRKIDSGCRTSSRLSSRRRRNSCGSGSSAGVAVPSTAASSASESISANSSFENTITREVPGRTIRTRRQAAAAEAGRCKEEKLPLSTSAVEENGIKKLQEEKSSSSSSSSQSIDNASDERKTGGAECRSSFSSIEDARQRAEEIARSTIAETAAWGRPSQWLRPRPDDPGNQNKSLEIRIPILKSDPREPHLVHVIRQHTQSNTASVLTTPTMKEEPKEREGNSDTSLPTGSSFVCQCGLFGAKSSEEKTRALKKGVRRERENAKTKSDRKRARQTEEEVLEEKEQSLQDNRSSLLSRVLSLETFERRLLEGGCYKSNYCLPHQIEDLLGPHALRVYEEVKNFAQVHSAVNLCSKWLCHYDFSYRGVDLLQTLLDLLEECLHLEGDFAFYEHEDVALSVPESPKHPLNRLMMLEDSRFVHLKESLPVGATEYPVAIWNSDKSIPKGTLVVLGVRTGEFLTDEEYREAIKDCEPNPVVEALRTVDVLPWLLSPDGQAGLLEAALTPLQGGLAAHADNVGAGSRASSAMSSVALSLRANYSKPHHHRPEVAWERETIQRNKAHKERASLRLRPGISAVPLYGLHFTSIRKFNKLSFVLHTGEKKSEAGGERFAAWSDWPEMKETVRAHLVTVDGWPVYVYTNNPEVEVLPGDELAMNMHNFPPLLPNTWYYTNDLNHKRRAYVEAQRENRAVAGYTSPLWLQKALRSGACLSVEDLTESELSDEESAVGRTKRALTCKRGRGRRRAARSDSDSDSDSCRPTESDSSTESRETDCSEYESNADSDTCLPSRVTRPRTCRNQSSSANCPIDGKGGEYQLSTVDSSAVSPSRCSKRLKERTADVAGGVSTGQASHFSSAKGDTSWQRGTENWQGPPVQSQQTERYAQLIQRYVFPQIALRCNDV